MRAMWKGSNDYFGVDNREISSYIYTDKKNTVLFKFLTTKEAGVDAEGKELISILNIRRNKPDYRLKGRPVYFYFEYS